MRQKKMSYVYKFGVELYIEKIYSIGRCLDTSQGIPLNLPYIIPLMPIS